MTTFVPFSIDLTAHEGARLAAHRLLYADLDADQQAAYDVLVTAGALPDIHEVMR